MTWRPIKEAQGVQDTVFDLWVISDGAPCGRRVTDCSPSTGGKDAWVDQDGKWVNGMYYTDDEGDECFAPGNNPRPEERVVCVLRRSFVTHFMSRPAPPTE